MIQTVECATFCSHSRYVNVGLYYLRQLFFATFDLSVHNNSLDVNTDYTKLWNDLRERISLVQGRLGISPVGTMLGAMGKHSKISCLYFYFIIWPTS